LRAANVPVYFIEKMPSGEVGGKSGVELNTLGSVVKLDGLACELSEYRALECMTEQPLLAVGEYMYNEEHYYMLFNESVEDSVDTEVILNSEGYVYRYDAMTDILYNVNKNEERIKLSLTPYESTILIVSKKPLEAEEDYSAIADSEIELPLLWNTSFSSAKDYPKTTKELGMNSLGFVHDLPEMSDKCGTVRFEADVDIPKARQALLNIEDAFEVCEVFVNKASAGIKIANPYVFDLTKLVHEGRNNIAIEITNTLGTQIRQPLGHYLPIEPFGVSGEISLKVKMG
jgi:hypothetical protein